MLSAFGTTLFFSSVDGRAWYDAHAIAMPFLCLAFLFAARGEKAWLVGACVGIATLSRLPIAAAAPALALLLARRGGIPFPRAATGLAFGGLPFAVVYVAYNLMRWDTPLDAGYARLAEGDVFFSHGLFSPLYLPRHVYAIFLEPPDLVEGVPYFLRPRFIGMSLFVTTPLFALLFFPRQRPRLWTPLWITAAAVAIPGFFYQNNGWQQFGFRFSLDYTPYLVVLLAISGRTFDGLFWFLAVAGVAINAWGAAAFNRP